MAHKPKRDAGSEKGRAGKWTIVKAGVREINIWQTYEPSSRGSIADDWRKVGGLIRDAMDAERLRG